jgi:hypothetical protein
MNDMYTWAWLRIENRSAFELSCQQGVLDAERAGSWTQNTNRIGYQYYPIIAPGQDLTVSINPPADATRWRSSFLLREVIAYDSKSWTRRQRFAAFMDSLRLDRLGLRSQPWHGLPAATVISSKTIDFQTTNALSSAPAK